MSLVGNLADLHLEDILQIIGLAHKSGILHMEFEGDEGKILFRKGKVAAAYIQKSGDRLLNVLVDQGVLSPNEKRAIEAELKRSVLTVRDILLREHKEFEEAIRFQVEHTVQHLLTKNTGTFRFELTEFEAGVETLSENARDLILADGLDSQFLGIQGSAPPLESEEESSDAMEVTLDTIDNLPFEWEEPPKAAEDGSLDLRTALKEEIGEEEFIESNIYPVIEDGQNKGMRVLKSLSSELADPTNSRQVVLLILRFASELMSRAIVFSVKSDKIQGVGQFGLRSTLDSSTDPDQLIRKIEIPLDQPSPLAEVVRTSSSFKGPLSSSVTNSFLQKAIGEHQPKEVFISPVTVGGKVVLLLYGDNLPDEKEIEDTDSLEIFLAQAGLAVEKALLEERLEKLKQREEG
jgi:polyhydroxyalkanoate synthesis regulator phasin